MQASRTPFGSLLRSSQFASASLLGLMLAACGGSGGSSGPQPGPPALEPALADQATASNLVDLLGTSDLKPVGLTLTPDTNDLYLLDARQGIYLLNDDNQFDLVVPAGQLYGQIDADSDFTDIAALGDNQFALTARNDGFLLDLDDESIRQHFCYVPGLIPPGGFEPPEQLTDSLAFDHTTGRILVQAVSIVQPLGIVNSEFGTFPLSGGIGEDWYPIFRGEQFAGFRLQYLAGAMSVDPRGNVWMAEFNKLERYSVDDGFLTGGMDLLEFGIQEAAGMVFDGDDVFIIDGLSLELVHLPARFWPRQDWKAGARQDPLSRNPVSRSRLPAE